MLDMRSGVLNQLVEFEHTVLAVDSAGQQVHSWQPLVSSWCRFIHLRGQERWLAAQVQAEGTITLEVRHIPALVTALAENVGRVRARQGNRVFHILAYRDPDERRKRLHLDVKEVL